MIFHENLASSSTPDHYAWVDDGVTDANLVVSKDATVAFLASLHEPSSFKLVRPTMEARVFDRTSFDSAEDWFYIYDYCMKTLRVRMSFFRF
ncbi:hypothetical protein SESBI_02428 [Sesbania bispinosa]|nr:hypothetical protein SESBI_02428 [Sesbania bispinosa]